MVRLFVRHMVSDFESWKHFYDDFESERQRLGVRGAALFCGAEDVNDVTAWHDFDDLTTAQAFVESPSLAEAMQKAGVVSEPQIWFVGREMPG